MGSPFGAIWSAKCRNFGGDDDELNFFVVWLTEKRRLALFIAGTIVRDPHHRESPTRRSQRLNLRRACAEFRLS